MADQESRSFEYRDPREVPNYTIAEAGHYLLIPPSTLRSWVGRPLPNETRERSAERPIIVLPNGGARLALSFINLVEAYVLDAVRRVYKVPLPEVGLALREPPKEVSWAHPLARRDSTRVIFSASLSRGNGLRFVLEGYLCRIDWDEENLPAKLYLLPKRPRRTVAPEFPRLVVLDPHVSFGRPVLVGTGIPTAAIAERFKSGESIASLAEDYGRQPIEIEAAIRFELQIEID